MSQLPKQAAEGISAASHHKAQDPGSGIVFTHFDPLLLFQHFLASHQNLRLKKKPQPTCNISGYSREYVCVHFINNIYWPKYETGTKTLHKLIYNLSLIEHNWHFISFIIMYIGFILFTSTNHHTFSDMYGTTSWTANSRHCILPK